MTASRAVAWIRAARTCGVFVALLLAFHLPAWSVEPLRLQSCERTALDAGQIEIARLPRLNQPIEQVLAASFKPLAGPASNLGIVDGAVWLRLSVAPGACNRPLLMQLGNPFANPVSIHRQRSDGVWAKVPESEYPLTSDGHTRVRYAMLPLQLERTGATNFLVEIVGPSSVMFRPAIVPASELHLDAIKRSLLGGVLSGGVVALAIYCALLAAMTRFSGMFAFSVSALALAGFYAMTVGLLDPLVISIVGRDGDFRMALLRLDGALGLTAALFHWLFVRGLLAVASQAPATTNSMAKRALVPAVIAAWAVIMLAVPFIEGPMVPNIAIAGACLAIVVMLFDVVRAVRGRHPIARVILAAVGVFSLSVLIFIGLYVGLLPFSPLLMHSIPAGTWVESIMLAAAVGTQVKALRGQQQRLAAQTRELSLLSQLDPLTGLSNRRAYDSVVPVEIDRCVRRGRTASLLVVDIDHFKQVNDNFGHGFGDSVIRMLGATIANSVRSTDYAFRYGGEEFVVLLPGLDKAMALEIAERIMREFTNCSPTAPDGTRPFFSVSIGLAQLRAGDDVQTFFGRADAAMYRAKQEGRCRTVVAEEAPPRARATEQQTARASAG
jgi:diguanylate cyclase (GGDEF)-like protein